MATRSAIAVKKANGTVQGVYCHWDGYPAHNGKILGDHYDYNKALQLITLGNLSSLAPQIGEQHDFDARYNGGEVKEDWCMFYHRDRGETRQDPKTFNTVGEFVDHYESSGAEYFYFIDTDGQWWVSHYSSRNDFQPVELAVERNEKEMA